MQTLAPVLEPRPGGQFEQTEAPGEKVPDVQAWHEAAEVPAPASTDLPAAQPWHPLAAPCSAHRPAAHGSQLEAPTGEVKAAGQSRQPAFGTREYLPALHWPHSATVLAVAPVPPDP